MVCEISREPDPKKNQLTLYRMGVTTKQFTSPPFSALLTCANEAAVTKRNKRFQSSYLSFVEKRSPEENWVICIVLRYFCRAQISQDNYRTMRFMSKQVSLPKISSILPKIKISPNQIFALFAQRPSIVCLYFFCLCRCCCCCCRRCVVLFFWFLLVVVVVSVAVVCFFACSFFFLLLNLSCLDFLLGSVYL